MAAESDPARRLPDSPIELGTVVCGIDSSPQGLEASRQAIELADEGARLWAVAVWDPAVAMYAGIHASEVRVDLRERAVTALREAREAFPALQPILLKGGEVAGLLSALTNLQADLVSVGPHGSSRAAGILFGGVATAMLHHAPCCVLVARRSEERSFPRLVLHAADGSVESLEAARVAGRIAARQGATVVTLHVGDGPERGSGLAEEAVALIEACGAEPAIRVESGAPERRIVEVAAQLGASLIVLGSRGRTGLRALGSVSERVAHRAPCSVLVARRPAHPAEEPA